jgi:hypothetical protein
MLALALAATPSFGAIQYTYSDDQATPFEGFRFSSPAGGPIDDLLEIGSNQPNNLDGLDFLRIQTPDNGGLNSIHNFILVLPEFRLSLLANHMCNPNGITTYGLDFATQDHLVRIYDAADTLLTTPLLIGTMNINNPLMVLTANGFVAPDIDYTDITNIVTTAPGGLFPDLVSLATMAAGSGADFSSTLSRALNQGEAFCTFIDAGTQFEGAANGDLTAVPEPGTILLLVAGAIGAVRSRRRA